MSFRTMNTYIAVARADWDSAHERLSQHIREHHNRRAWHPLGTPEREAADLRASREFARLQDAERMTRAVLASRMRTMRLLPLPSGLFEMIQ